MVCGGGYRLLLLFFTLYIRYGLERGRGSGEGVRDAG